MKSPLGSIALRLVLLVLGFTLVVWRVQAAVPDAAVAGRDYIELRAYRLKAETLADALDSYLEKVLIPALNVQGIGAVGAFTETEPKEGSAIWVLIPYASLDAFVKVTALLNADPEVQAKGADYLKVPTKNNPAFDRIDSWLFLSFAGQPRLVVPSLAREKKPRIFEMRTYESHGELAALQKIQMFNSGEIGVMQELNLSPVFYGQALTGRGLPQLTYLLCSPDEATHKKNWQAFQQHPTWLKLKADPQYKDTVSKSVSRMLRPKPYSQI